MSFHRAVFILAMAAMSLPVHAEEAGVPPHWSYIGETGPEFWGKLAKEFESCSVGSTQSPIDIQDSLAIRATLPALETGYQPFPLAILNNGHTIQVAGVEGNGFTVDEQRYELLQFHFHSPSEYWLNGKHYPLEVHLVHKRADGALGVIGIMFEAGEANPVLDQVFAHLPAAAGETGAYPEVQVDLNALLPENQRYYRLMGSLTTPPCSEGVNWFVMETPITASQEQIDAFTTLFPDGDARPIQAANNRLVVKGN